MKIPLSLSVVLCAFLADSPLQGGELLVDSNFEVADAEGTLATSNRNQLPLALPTSVSATPPSTITSGKESLGELKPPYAVVKVEGRDGSPDAPANATIQWDLRKVPGLSSGKFEITYTAAIVEPTASGGMFRVNFENESGAAGSIHPSTRPLTVLFRGDQVRSNTKGTSSVSVVYGTPFTVKMTCDLDANVWSATVDGTPIVENVPFSEAFLAAYPNRKILNLEFGSLGGEGHAPAGTFAIANVKMERLD